MIHVRARAPTRVDLAGGTLDLWPVHHLLSRKVTVNVAVGLDAKVEVSESADGAFHIVSQDQGSTVNGTYDEVVTTTTLPLVGLLVSALWKREFPALTITTAAKSPAGAGLGGSSCLGITLAGALWRARQRVETIRDLSHDELVRVVQDVEARLIKAPTGCQDYWGAVRGGINVIEFPFGGTKVETLPPSCLPELKEELILCYSGKSRASAINNWEIFKRLFDGDTRLLDIFNRIGETAWECGQAVAQGDYARMLSLSQAEWHLRTELWPAIETDETRRLDQAARTAGARFSRVCGAGGGGVMAVFAPKEARADVEKALQGAGGVVLRADIAGQGLAVEG